MKEYKAISNPHRKPGTHNKNDNNSSSTNNNLNNNILEHGNIPKDILNNQTIGSKQTGKVINDDKDSNLDSSIEYYDGEMTDYNDNTLKNEEKKFEAKENKNEPPSIQAKKLLEKGLINSFVDFFYIYQRKIPDLSNSIRKIFSGEPTPQKPSEDHSNNLISLKVKLKLAERKYMRQKNYPVVINKYLDIRTQILQLGDSVSSIYFNQNAIRLASNRYQTDYSIKSLLLMGDCFQNPEDSEIRIYFKEIEAYENIYMRYGSKNPWLNLEKYLYTSLVKLFQDLALQQEQQNKYEESIKHLQKQLIYLNMKYDITKNNNDASKKEDEQQTIEIYLKVADLNYKQGNFHDAERVLNIAQELIDRKPPDFNSLKLKCLFQYAQTYEAQSKYDKAIEKLNLIDASIAENTSIEDNLYSKSYLNLGRLYYKQNNLEMADKNLQKFFKESKKNESKELLDLARVNLGMIKGTKGLNDMIKLSKTSSYQDFLKMKLKFFTEC